MFHARQHACMHTRPIEKGVWEGGGVSACTASERGQLFLAAPMRQHCALRSVKTFYTYCTLLSYFPCSIIIGGGTAPRGEYTIQVGSMLASPAAALTSSSRFIRSLTVESLFWNMTWQAADTFSFLALEVVVQSGHHTANKVHLNETFNLVRAAEVLCFLETSEKSAIEARP